jgi:hypothetical protein
VTVEEAVANVHHTTNQLVAHCLFASSTHWIKTCAPLKNPDTVCEIKILLSPKNESIPGALNPESSFAV